MGVISSHHFSYTANRGYHDIYGMVVSSFVQLNSALEDEAHWMTVSL